MAKRKHSADWMLARVREYLSGKGSYRQIARANGISVQSLRGWVRKYVADGETGLIDRRGHHKTDEEVDEMERLRRENQRLKRQLEEQERLVYFLKKLKALEGR